MLDAAQYLADHIHEAPVWIVPCMGGGTPTRTSGSSIYPAVQNLLLSAREIGLGAALTTLLCAFEPQVKELLAIPQDVATAGMIVLGWPARPLATRLTRRPLEDAVFAERYGEPLLSGH